MEKLEEEISKLHIVVSDCIDLDNEDIIENDNKNIYLNQQYVEANELLSELYSKMENIKYLLMTDKVSPGEVNYIEMINEKIESNNSYKKFIDIFGPYMALFSATIC